MLSEAIGLPQAAALLVLLQRGAEEFYSARNTRALLAAGATEAGRDYYPVVATTHLAWIASLFFLVPPAAEASIALAVAYLALQGVRERVMALFEQLAVERDGVRIVGEKLSQVEIASRVGASRDMISRVFKELQSDGSIRVDRKQITLVGPG